MKFRLLLSIIALALCGAPALADFDDYKPSTLKDVFAIDHEGCSKLTEKQFVADMLRQVFTVSATWTGDVRPIRAKSSRILEQYGAATRLPADMKQLFQHEVRVRDAGADYWLPIQEPILPMFTKEVGSDGVATLYVAFLGCHNEGVVTINEFHAAGH